MKKIDKLNFFFKYFKVDLWSYFFYKANLKTRLGQRYFVSMQNNLDGSLNYFFSKIFKKHNNLIKLKYNDVYRLKNKVINLSSWFEKNALKIKKKSKNYSNLKAYKIKKESYKNFKLPSLKSGRLNKNKFYLNNIFSNLSKDVYYNQLLLSKNAKKFNLHISTVNLGVLKKRLGTASYDLFFADFEGYRFKPRSRIKKKASSKLNWHYWLNKKIISYYFVFRKVKNYTNWKKRLKKKNFLHNKPLGYILENCLLSFLVNMGVFTSFKHVYNLIKYGGVKINKILCEDPYKLIKKNYELEFTTFVLKQKFLNFFLKKTSYHYYPLNFFCNNYDIYLPLVLIKKLTNFSVCNTSKLIKFSRVPKVQSWF